MTILSDLCDYYDLVREMKPSPVPERFWAEKKVKWAITLASDSSIVSCIPLVDEKGNGQSLIVPQGQRTSGIQAFFLCDNHEYWFGDDPKGGKEKHENICRLHHDVLDGVDDDAARTILAFLDRIPHIDEIDASVRMMLSENKDLIVFRLEGDHCYMHERPLIHAAWNQYCERRDEEAGYSPCLVTGNDHLPRAGLYPQITGLPGAKSSGASLVGANQPAFRSYGQPEGDIGSISAEAADKSSLALTYLLKDRDHRCHIGDDLVAFWADSTQQTVVDCLSFLIDPDQVSEDNSLLPKSEDKNLRDRISQCLEDIRKGMPISGIDISTAYHVVGIAPYQARLAVRFYETGTLGDLEDNARSFLNDTEMIHVRPCSIRAYLEQTVSPGKSGTIPQPLVTSTMRSYLHGLPFPRSLFEQLLMRTRIDHGSKNPWDLGRRVAMMRVILLRDARAHGENEGNEAERTLTVALNKENTNTGYVLGRLFALLEKAQLDAIGQANATIRDRYMGAAASTPERVFPQLMKLSQHHVSKSEYGGYVDRCIQEVVSKLDPNGFPKILSYDDQGKFYIGYYHQKEDLYTKHADDPEEASDSTNDDELSD